MSHSRKRIRHKDYCQYLLSSQQNYTLTHYAEQAGWFSHDKVNRFLRDANLPPRILWEQVRGQIVPSEQGCIVFDDTVLDKRYAAEIEPVRSQYSGNAHSVIRGIGVVTCIYVNPETDQFWAIDWRIFDPDKDGKSKNDHVREMLRNLHHHKKLPYRAVLMDSWYANTELMLMIADLGKTYYCPIKSNRQVDDSGNRQDYRPVSALAWSQAEQMEGKTVKLKGFPKDYMLRLFRLPVSPDRTDFVITNDKTCRSIDAVRKACAVRWKIEQLHRELKQNCGIERCQCRTGRIQRNHIACAFLVWNRLKSLAYQSAMTVYQIKAAPLKALLAKELSCPTVVFA
jgi:hypothetical protein